MDRYRCGCMKLKSMYLVDLYRGSYKGNDFRSKQFDELLLKVHIKIVLVDESYFGNKKIKFFGYSLNSNKM